MTKSTEYLRSVVKKFSDYTEAGKQADQDFRGIYYEWAKFELEKRGDKPLPINKTRIDATLARVNERRDCGDFVMPGIEAVLLLYEDSSLLDASLVRALREAVLHFKYSIEDPGEDTYAVCYYTENHQILFACSEYIAGQLYPDETFTNNNWKGAVHFTRGRKRVLEWINWRMRFGFSEWLSNGYYGEDLLALAVLNSLSKEEDIRRKSGEVIELLLFDIALNSFEGVLGATSGRMYTRLAMRPENSATSAVSKLFWDEGSWDGGISIGCIALAVFNYKPGKTVLDAALYKGRFRNLQRMSLDVEEAPKYGIHPEDYNDIMFFWGQQTMFHRRVIANSQKLSPEWFYLRAGINAHADHYLTAEKAGLYVDPDENCLALTRVNVHTWKTPYYTISCAQDFRKGRVGFQQHIWQATLGNRAIVFTNHPGFPGYRERPSQFLGNGFMPRAAAHKNVVLCVYRIPAESGHNTYNTHAYFPQEAFDEIKEAEGWIFGRKGKGYVALKSSLPGLWQEPDAELFKVLEGIDYEKGYMQTRPYCYQVRSHTVIWVCEMGDEDESGSFETFIASFGSAGIKGDSYKFTYNSPALGDISFGWIEPLTVSGDVVPLGGYKRYDNPWLRAEFGTEIEIT